MKKRVLVIGGGLFGCSIASSLAEAGAQVALVEAAPKLLDKASRFNHNRLHLGYHYLRSVGTAKQSMEGFFSFIFSYSPACRFSFENIYAIAKKGSKSSSEDFKNFCERVGIAANKKVVSPEYLNPEMITDSYLVPEPIFDIDHLSQIIGNSLRKNEVDIRLNTKLTSLHSKNDLFRAGFNHYVAQEEFDVVVNSTYTNINVINSYLGLPQREYLYENVLIPVFYMDHPSLGLTVMDGPFCSVMPRGMKENQFLLYHVEHSILEAALQIDPPENQREATPADITKIYEKSVPFMPFLRDVKHLDTYSALRVVPKNDDDARLSEVYQPEELPNYFSVLSGKVTTCTMAAQQIKEAVFEDLTSVPTGILDEANPTPFLGIS